MLVIVVAQWCCFRLSPWSSRRTAAVGEEVVEVVEVCPWRSAATALELRRCGVVARGCESGRARLGRMLVASLTAKGSPWQNGFLVVVTNASKARLL